MTEGQSEAVREVDGRIIRFVFNHATNTGALDFGWIAPISGSLWLAAADLIREVLIGPRCLPAPFVTTASTVVLYGALVGEEIEHADDIPPDDSPDAQHVQSIRYSLMTGGSKP